MLQPKQMNGPENMWCISMIDIWKVTLLNQLL